MYIPKHFVQDDQQQLLILIRDYPLATMVVQTPEGLAANHIPLIIDDENSSPLHLHGHIARANALSQIESPVDALVIFHGPQAYISPNWYATKQQHGKAVPTWNYSTVHVSASLRLVDDRAWKLNMIGRLTDKEEAPQAAPWKVADAPAAFTEGLLSSIVGIELVVSKIEGKWKVSQNQPLKNRDGVRQGLLDSGNSAAEYLSGQ